VDESHTLLEQQPEPLPLAYCTDVSRIPPETWPHLRALRTLVLDMLRYRRHPTHLSVDEAVSTAASIGADATYFTHMTHDIRHAHLDPALPSGMALSFDGLVIG
jgi:phosphoribosyl 1,2-cyclic phosphate phosphodiesterase